MGGWVAMAEVEVVEVAECDREGGSPHVAESSLHCCSPRR